MKQIVFFVILFALTLLTACVGGSRAMRSGGEVTGQRAVNYNEPAPFGMIEVKRGFLRAGMETDSLWGLPVPQREISVDGFWMDQTEVTNSMYRQFVEWVRDSIIRERLADPAYGGDETYKITEDEFVELASEECKKMFLELSHTGEQSVVDVLLPMTCAKFSGRLAARIFADNNDENAAVEIEPKPDTKEKIYNLLR